MAVSNRVQQWGRAARRPLEQHRKSSLGVIALIVLIAVLSAAVGFNSLKVGEKRYAAEFAQAAGIRTGDSVTIAGVDVGTVSTRKLAGDRVLLTLSVDREVHLGENTRAAIKLTTLLGSRYIELQPSGEEELPDDRLTLDQTSVPYDLQKALESATTTFEDVDAEKIGASLDSLATELGPVPQVLPGLLDNMRSLASMLGSRRDEVGSLLTGTQRLTAVVSQQRDDLGAIATQGRDLLTEIVTRHGALVRLMDATTKLVEQLRKIVVEDRPQVDELLSGLDNLLGSLARHDELLRNTMQILPVPIRNFANASGTGNEVDFTAPAGPMIDSWMCALSGRAEQGALSPYFEDCE